VIGGEDQAGERTLAPGQGCVLGRGREVDLRIRDPDASRKHAIVEATPAGLRVTDLGGRNGTLLEGERLPPHRPVPVPAPQATLQIGTTRIALRWGAPSAAPAPAPALKVAEEFELLAELGSGGNGLVVAARHRASGRRVAIKRLHAQVEADPEVRERFLREARIRLDSPHVVQIYDVRLEGPIAFIVMELVEGTTAEQLVAQGPLPFPQVFAIAEQVTRALDAAHRAKLVHRDLKPANVFVRQDGCVKLGDFGIAKDLSGAQESLTASGAGLGTLAYVAPEQAEDAKWVDPQADLYSLGATLYHLLAGSPPFVASGPEVLERIQEEEPPPLLGLRPDCPPALATLVHELLAKDPDDRPEGAAAVLRRLAALRA